MWSNIRVSFPRFCVTFNIGTFCNTVKDKLSFLTDLDASFVVSIFFLRFFFSRVIFPNSFDIL